MGGLYPIGALGLLNVKTNIDLGTPFSLVYVAEAVIPLLNHGAFGSIGPYKQSH